MTSLLEARGVVRQFGSGSTEVHVLRGVDLTMTDGEIIVLHGRSGSGKTTLLNLIGGLDRADSGTLEVCGHQLHSCKSDELVELRRDKVSFVFQAFGLIPVLSAAENIEVPLRIRGVDGAERDRRVSEALEWVELSTRSRHRPGEMSGGEQQRVAIARALVAEPRLLIADEPTGQLDAATGHRIITLLSDLSRERGLALLIATHDPALVARADRSIGLQSGRLVEDPTQ